jgi:hypothetical protein
LIIAVTRGVLGAFSIVRQRSLMRLALEWRLRLQYDTVLTVMSRPSRDMT